MVNGFLLLSGVFSLLLLAQRCLAQQPNDFPSPASIRETQITKPEIPEDISPAKNLSIPGPDGNTVIAVFRQPPGQGPFPVVIYLHGGRERRDLDQLRWDSLKLPTMSRFLAAGYVTVCPTFRSREKDIQSPDAFRDCLALVAAVKRMPAIDPKSVVIFGQSGGGDLALKLAGAVPLAAIAVEEPATVIYTGVIHRGFMDQTAVDQVTRNPGDFYTPELKRQTQEKIRRISCPIFFAYGDWQNINFFNNEIVLPELKAARKNVNIVRYPDQRHGFSLGLFSQEAALKFFKDCEAFLRPHLATQPSGLKDSQFHMVPAAEKGNGRDSKSRP